MHEDAVWDALARALAGEYEIVARLGLGSGGAPVYLARELVTDTLVALRLPRLESESSAREFGLEIVRRIDGTLPGIEAKCSHCGAPLRQWPRFCGRCGKEVSGVAPSVEGQSRDTLRQLAREAAAGKYDVIGEMARAEGGGLVYFGRELSTGEVVGLRLEPGPEATLLLTAMPFATPDPRIELPEARRPSQAQRTRRVSVPLTGAKPRGGTSGLRIAGAVVLAVILIGLLVYRLI